MIGHLQFYAKKSYCEVFGRSVDNHQTFLQQQPFLYTHVLRNTGLRAALQEGWLYGRYNNAATFRPNNCTFDLFKGFLKAIFKFVAFTFVEISLYGSFSEGIDPRCHSKNEIQEDLDQENQLILQQGKAQLPICLSLQLLL